VASNVRALATLLHVPRTAQVGEPKGEVDAMEVSHVCQRMTDPYCSEAATLRKASSEASHISVAGRTLTLVSLS